MLRWIRECAYRIVNFLSKIYDQINNFYVNYNSFIKLIIIACLIFSSVNWLEYQHNFYYNQEVFDLRKVPSGYVVWVYPKDKTQNPFMPDSLKKEFEITDNPTSSNKLNYNVNVWVIGIYTMEGKIIKVEVPDYAISQFKLDEMFYAPPISN